MPAAGGTLRYARRGVITCRVFEDGGLKHEIPFEPDAIRQAREDDHRAGPLYRTFHRRDWL